MEPQLNISMTHTMEQSARLSQQQMLSQKQLQSLHLLWLPITELRNEMTQMVETNPVLEVVKMPEMADEKAERAERLESLQNCDDINRALSDGEAEGAADLGDSWDAFAADASDWSNAVDSEYEAKRQFLFENTAAIESPLDDLLLQVRDLTKGNDALRRAAEAVIGNLDDRGYLAASDIDLALTANVEPKVVAEAKRLVRHLEPSGLGCRTLQECLQAQLEAAGEGGSLAWKLAGEHLEDIAGNRLPQLARALSVSLDDIRKAVERIRQLNPEPGASLSSQRELYITPEATVFKNADDEWMVQMNDDWLPVLAVREEYRAMATDKQQTVETRRYLREKIGEYDQFYFQLEQRQRTIKRITLCIVDHQRAFLEEGITKLRPLLQSDVARELSLDESTISRAIAQKYLKTPYGILEYKFFFSQALSGAANGDSDHADDVSTRAVRARIRELIEEENPAKPLSDQKIADILAQEGITVARRTVAKYREAEGIAATSLRKQH